MRDEFVTPDEMATILKVPKSWLYSRTRERGANVIPMIRVGKYIRFEAKKVLEWIEEQQAH